LHSDRIIIFGGTSTVAADDLAPGDSLYVLYLPTFYWQIPMVTGQIPKSRMFHKANVIDDYMVVTFGKYFYLYF